MMKFFGCVLLFTFSSLDILAADHPISKTDWQKHAVAYYADVPMAKHLRERLLNDHEIELVDKDETVLGTQYNLFDIVTKISSQINSADEPVAVIFLGDGYGGESFRFHAHHPDIPIFTCDINQHLLQGLLDLVENAKNSTLITQKKLAQNLKVSVADASELYKSEDFQQFLLRTQGMKKFIVAFNLFHQMKPSDIFVLIYQMAAIMNPLDRMYILFDSIYPYDQYIQYLKTTGRQLFAWDRKAASATVMASLIKEQSREEYAFPGYANEPLVGQKIYHGMSDICYCPSTTSTWVADTFVDAGFEIVKNELVLKFSSSRIESWKREFLNTTIGCTRFIEISKIGDAFFGNGRKIMGEILPKIRRVADADSGLVEFLKDKTITYEDRPPFLFLSKKKQ